MVQFAKSYSFFRRVVTMLVQIDCTGQEGIDCVPWILARKNLSSLICCLLLMLTLKGGIRPPWVSQRSPRLRVSMQSSNLFQDLINVITPFSKLELTTILHNSHRNTSVIDLSLPYFLLSTFLLDILCGGGLK